MLALLLGINLPIAVVLVLISPRLFPLFFVPLAFSFTIVAPFFDVPSLVKKGGLTYHSLFLLAEKPKKDTVTLHGGTLFDYYFTLERGWSGQLRTAFILAEYLRGLLSLMEYFPDDMKLRGTSYIIQERTARKVGMLKAPTDGIQVFLLTFNYFNLMASLYLAKGKLTFPNLNRVHTFEGTIGALRENEGFIRGMLKRLEEGALGKTTQMGN